MYMYKKVATPRRVSSKTINVDVNHPHLLLSVTEPATATTVAAKVAARGRGALRWASTLVACSLAGGAGEARATESSVSTGGIAGLGGRAGSRGRGGVGRCRGLGGSRRLGGGGGGGGGDRRGGGTAAAAAAVIVVLGSHGRDGELGNGPGLSIV